MRPLSPCTAESSAVRSPSKQPLPPATFLMSLLLLCAACSREQASRATTTTPPSATGAPSATASVSASAPKDDVPPVALQRACAESCVRPGELLAVFRDESGAPALIRARGLGCSHGPDVYIDMRGQVAETIANQPVAPGSPEAARFQERIDDLLRGLQESERVQCPGEGRMGW